MSEIATKQAKQVLVKPYTVYILCGPSMCGKSTWLDNQPFFDDYSVDYNVISSDSIRRSLLSFKEDYSTHRHSADMQSVSKQAFSVLMNTLEAQMAYPISVKHLFIDSTGMSESFRDEVRALAKKHGYNVALITFEYKNRAEYLKYADESLDEPFIVNKHVDRFLKKVLPEIKSRDYSQRIRIKSRDDTTELVEDAILVRHHRLQIPEGYCLAVIGDVHECISEMQDLIHNVSKAETSPIFVQVGDYLDKGGNTEQTVQAVWELNSSGTVIFIRGNHEAYIYRRLFENMEPQLDVEEKYFTALKVLQENPALAEMFKEVYNSSYDYVTAFVGNKRNVIITHAPCENIFLGRESATAVRAMRNLRLDRDRPVRDQLQFIYDDADFSYATHVFGHVAHKSEQLFFKNKMFLDTGAVHGGKLTCAVFDQFGVRTHAVDCSHRWSNGLDSLPDDLTYKKEEKAFDIKNYDLSAQDQRLLSQAMSKGVRYISGTMPPAPSSSAGLETLGACFEYFRKKGVSALVLQPKYMGSRVQLYLNRDKAKSFAVSRSGWVMRPIPGLEDLMAFWHGKVFSDLAAATEVVLDGELLPWRALGAGLIDKEFTPYGALVEEELSALWEDPWFQNSKLGQDFNVFDKKTHKEKYEASLALYSGDTPLEYKPFDVLLIDGVRPELDAYEAFEAYNDDLQFIVLLNDAGSCAAAQEFYDALTVSLGYEGVVAKPMACEGEECNAPPYMKVRNPEYLRLIYGYDYPDRVEGLIRQKNISGKAATAIREYNMACEMLTSDDAKRKELIVKMIGELRREAEFDPRL